MFQENNLALCNATYLWLLKLRIYNAGSYKKIVFNTFFNLKFLMDFVFKVLNIVSFNCNKNMNMLYLKNAKVNKMTQKNFYMNVVQL